MTTASAAIRVCRLFVSPGHNYFGHHGQPAGRNPILEVPEVECVAGAGIRGDRFFGYQENYKGQITFFSLEVFEGLRRELGLVDAEPSAMRRNVLVSGVELNSLVDTEFTIQGVHFAGVSECSPCHWMNDALGPGAEGWLKGRGGLRARILTDGRLRASVGASWPAKSGIEFPGQGSLARQGELALGAPAAP